MRWTCHLSDALRLLNLRWRSLGDSLALNLLLLSLLNLLLSHVRVRCHLLDLRWSITVVGRLGRFDDWDLLLDSLLHLLRLGNLLLLHLWIALLGHHIWRPLNLLNFLDVRLIVAHLRRLRLVLVLVLLVHVSRHLMLLGDWRPVLRRCVHVLSSHLQVIRHSHSFVVVPLVSLIDRARAHLIELTLLLAFDLHLTI